MKPHFFLIYMIRKNIILAELLIHDDKYMKLTLRSSFSPEKFALYSLIRFISFISCIENKIYNRGLFNIAFYSKSLYNNRLSFAKTNKFVIQQQKKN